MLDWLWEYMPIIQSYAAGVLTALVSVAWKHYLDKRQRKREFTTNILLQLNSGQFLAPIAYRAYALASSNRSFLTELSEEELGVIEQTLDFLEFVAISCRQKIVDLDTLVRQEGMPMIKLYDAACPWINEYRKRPGSKTVYQELQALMPLVRKRHNAIYRKIEAA